MVRRSSVLAAALVVMLAIAPLLAGCTAGASGASGGGRFASAPLILREAPATVHEAYEYALEYPEVLSKVACYCGCESAGHRNVRDCFVKEVRADGSVEWDLMGAG